MTEAHPLVDKATNVNNEGVILTYRADSGPELSDIRLDSEEKTDKFTPQQLHELMADFSALPKEYAIQYQTVEQFLGPEEVVDDVLACTEFTMNTGQTFSRGELIGKGGQGFVYEGDIPVELNDAGEVVNLTDTKDYINAVMKIMPIGGAQDFKTVCREMVAWSDRKGLGSSSPTLVGAKIYMTKAQKKFLVLALERGQGDDLQARMSVEHFGEQQASGSFRLELMEGMRACVRELEHMSSPEKQWIHGDIKPANILLHGSRSTLLDWGIGYKQGDPTVELRPGFVRGTPLYLSADALLGKDQQRNPDWYGLGLTFAEALGTIDFPQVDGHTLGLADLLLYVDQHGTTIDTAVLTAQNYHSILKTKLSRAPERDFAWLCYRLVQPHCRPGEYVRPFNNYQAMSDELLNIITRQRLRLRTENLHNTLEHYIATNFQSHSEAGLRPAQELLQKLKQALDSENDHAINESAAATQLYFKKLRQAAPSDRRLPKVTLKREAADSQAARFKSLSASVVSLISRLIKNYTHNRSSVPATFTEHLMTGVQTAERHFAQDEPEVAFGILHLMQQDLSRLLLTQEQGQELRLRYYNYDDLMKEFRFEEVESGDMADEITVSLAH